MTDDENREKRAESLFEAFLRHVEAGEDPDFEKLCAEHPQDADGLRILHSIHVAQSSVKPDSAETLPGVPPREDDAECDEGSPADSAARYCTGCGREIGQTLVCPDCATPNFFRDQ